MAGTDEKIGKFFDAESASCALVDTPALGSTGVYWSGCLWTAGGGDEEIGSSGPFVSAGG